MGAQISLQIENDQKNVGQVQVAVPVPTTKGGKSFKPVSMATHPPTHLIITHDSSSPGAPAVSAKMER